MCCHKKSCSCFMIILLHILVLVSLGTACCLKDTRTGKRIKKKMQDVGEKIEEKAEDMLTSH